MQVTSLPGSTASAGGSATSKGMGGLTGQDFMNLLIKQLEFQDPLKPMDNSEMMKQMATIRELEMNTTLTGQLQQLSEQQRFGSAAALIGKHVKGTVTDKEGNAFEMKGTVQSVQFTSRGDVMLALDSGDTLPLAKLEEVTDPQSGQTMTMAPETKVAAGPAARILSKLLKR